MTRREARVFVISGPSGGGKTTVVSRLRRVLPRVVRSVSVTTRPARAGERQRREYRFVSPARFEELRRSGQLLEWAAVHGARYGTPKAPVLRALSRGRHVILSIDVQGARAVRRAIGRRAVLIFLLPPSLPQLRKRLTQRRTDTPEAIRRRLQTAKQELACAAWYDYVVVNNRLGKTVTDVRRIIEGKGVEASWRKYRSKSS